MRHSNCDHWHQRSCTAEHQKRVGDVLEHPAVLLRRKEMLLNSPCSHTNAGTDRYHTCKHCAIQEKFNRQVAYETTFTCTRTREANIPSTCTGNCSMSLLLLPLPCRTHAVSSVLSLRACSVPPCVIRLEDNQSGAAEPTMHTTM